MANEGSCNNLQKIRVNWTPQVTLPDGSKRPAMIDGPLRVEVRSGDGSALVDPELPLQTQMISGDEEEADTIIRVSADTDRDPLLDNLIFVDFVLHVVSQMADSFGAPEILAPELK